MRLARLEACTCLSFIPIIETYTLLIRFIVRVWGEWAGSFAVTVQSDAVISAAVISM